MIDVTPDCELLSRDLLRYRRQSLHQQLEWLRAVESTDADTARRYLRRRLRKDAAEAQSDLERVRNWPGMPDYAVRVLESAPEAVRLIHLVGLVPRGSRVLDVGCGPGLVAGTLALHGRLEAYLGVDLGAARIDAAREMAIANGLDRLLEFAVGDARALPADRLDALDPDTVLLLEILEHLTEPAAVLTAIADLVAPTARIIFSVPILGRIEACWGHRSLFGADALLNLTSQCGLDLESVHEVHNAWAVAVARRTPTAASSGDGAATVPPTAVHRVASDDVMVEGARVRQGSKSATVIEVAAGRTAELTAPTPGATWARLDLEFGTHCAPRRVHVATLDRDGRFVSEWRLDPETFTNRSRFTLIVRPDGPNVTGTVVHHSDREPMRISLVVAAGDQPSELTVWRVDHADSHPPARRRLVLIPASLD